ncbi:hypothetical protein ACRALDRAFT_1072445 [Sodiomyces alcalophilus JCM 7366]|uniref:uncharacterized protein n=1 Tax=Sodiomyces alcalophilus JCM 7366 TaxID=591952 RepID=UPI0039B65604
MSNRKKGKARWAGRAEREGMVRFLEMKKAERHVKKFKKLLGPTEDPHFRQKITDAIHLSEVDLMHTQYAPRLEPYISLWSKEKTTDKDKEAQRTASQVATHSHSKGQTEEVVFEDRQNRPPMWFLIEQAMREGTAVLEKIRDRGDVSVFHSRPSVVLGSGRQRDIEGRGESQNQDENS